MFKKLKISMLMFIGLLLSSMTSVAKSSDSPDVVLLCNKCSSVIMEQVALQARTWSSIVHVVDFTTGESQSFDVDHDLSSHTAKPVTTPKDITTGTIEVKKFIEQMINHGGAYDATENMLTRQLSIPADVAATSTDVLSDAMSIKIGKYIGTQLKPTNWELFATKWKPIIQELFFKVETRYVDGSTVPFMLNPRIPL
ncbi:MAG: hypothetical protein ACI8WB_002732 [Phenylobacterium sp.]